MSRFPDRRDFLTFGVGAFAVAALPERLFARGRLVRRTVPVMGTIAELAVVERSETRAHRALDAAVSELRRIEGLMSWFRDDSDVGRANLTARSGRPVAVSSETADVLQAALGWARASGGAFDPCLGRAVRTWDVSHRAAPPPAAERHELAHRALWRALEVETSGSVPRVTLHDPEISVDLGGIAKGYGVDAAARALRDHGIFRGLVNVGGDLAAAGTSEDGDPWKIGVRSPESARRLLTTLEVRDGALATSGDYVRYFDYGGRRYHHLLDPATGEPRRTRMHTVTVAASSCMAADAGATAVFGMPRGEADAMLARAAPGAWVAHTDGE